LPNLSPWVIAKTPYAHTENWGVPLNLKFISKFKLLKKQEERWNYEYYN